MPLVREKGYKGKIKPEWEKIAHLYGEATWPRLLSTLVWGLEGLGKQ